MADPKPTPTPASTSSPEDISAKNERLYALMDRMAKEAEAKKKKEDAAKAAGERKDEGNLARGARQGRGGLGRHTGKLLDQIDD